MELVKVGAGTPGEIGVLLRKAGAPLREMCGGTNVEIDVVAELDERILHTVIDDDLHAAAVCGFQVGRIVVIDVIGRSQRAQHGLVLVGDGLAHIDTRRSRQVKGLLIEVQITDVEGLVEMVPVQDLRRTSRWNSAIPNIDAAIVRAPDSLTVAIVWAVPSLVDSCRLNRIKTKRRGG